MRTTSSLRERMILAMKVRNMSPLTIKVYVRVVSELAVHYDRSPDQLSVEQLQEYLEYLCTKRNLSWSSLNVAFSAFRFLYGQVLNQEKIRLSIPCRRSCKQLPRVLSIEEVMQIVRSGSTVKSRTLLLTVYGCGLRVSEVCKLRPEDICSANNRVRVAQGKGNKDRYTLLPQKVLEELRNYWRIDQPGTWLFPGRYKNRPLATGSAQRVYYGALKRSGVKKLGGIHILRHCFATHLLKDGWDVYMIKQFMGHTSIATTGRYFNLVDLNAPDQKNPLDNIEDDNIHPLQ